MRLIFSILFFINVVACADNSNGQMDKIGASDTARENIELGDAKQAQDLTGCYMKIVGRDTAILMLEQKGKQLAGKMLYDNFEKDGSRGTVKGKTEGEILKLWYDFNSEGMHSVSEVYFKTDSSRLLRGVGDMDVKTDTAYFISGINYSVKEAFNKVSCDLVKWKF